MVRWLLLAFALIACTTAAVAHDDPQNWIGQEKRMNANGQLCCGHDDCLRYEPDAVKVAPDGYHFPDGDVIAFNKAAPSIDHWYWKCRWQGEVKCTFAPFGAS